MKKPVEATTQNSFNRSVDSASETVHHAIDHAAEAASPLITRVTKGAHQTVDKMANGANNAADSFVHKGEQLNSLKQKLTNGTRAQVRGHPLLALTAALAGGALLGFWLTRKGDAK
ncbi:hypothetical protein [Pseudidiomarina sp. YC-516-91]|uniref:hypothetical protein n=1 Tax=Pseudidiomarina salilacus TaxID=3384452 RepID=UPI00398545C1